MQHENFLRENNARHFWHPMAHPAEMLETPPMIISKAENVEVRKPGKSIRIRPVGGDRPTNQRQTLKLLKKRG